MPSGKATKPGDVVTSMSGKTIQVRVWVRSHAATANAKVTSLLWGHSILNVLFSLSELKKRHRFCGFAFIFHSVNDPLTRYLFHSKHDLAKYVTLQ